MIFTEKVKFNGINKQISPGAVDNQGNRMIVNPIIDALNARYLSSEAGDELIAESILGNTEVSNANLPTGTNKCIGWCEDKQRNCIYYFVYNTSDNHCIFKYVPETGVITLIIKKAELNFQDDRRYMVTSAQVVNDLLIWNDSFNNTGYINTTRDYTYSGFIEQHIRIDKKQPFKRPDVNPTHANPSDDHAYWRGDDTSLTTNLITDKNFQFSYRVIYLDNELSNFAPYSVLSWGDRFSDFTKNTENKILVRVTLANADTYAKKIQFLYREDNDDTWKVWASVDPTGSSTYDQYFTGTQFLEEVPESEAYKLFEATPNYSSASCIQKDRLFLVENESGFTGENDPILTITKNNVIRDPMRSTWSPGGRRKFGIAVFDANQHSIGVLSPKEVAFVDDEVPALSYPGPLYTNSFSTNTIGTGSKTFVITDLDIAKYAAVGNSLRAHATDTGLVRMTGLITAINTSTGSITVNFTTSSGSGTYSVWSIHIKGMTTSAMTRIDIDISGNLSDYPQAKYYSVVVSDDLFHDERIQIPARVLFYKFDKTGDYSPTAAEVVIDGKVFTKTIPSTAAGYSKVYIQLPRETPIAIDDSFYVKILNKDPILSFVPKAEKILAVDGDFLILNSFGIADWTNLGLSSGNTFVLIDLYRIKQSNESTLYYEITERLALNSDGTIPTASFDDLGGDSYYMSNHYSFRQFKKKPDYFADSFIDSSVHSLSPIGVVSTDVSKNAPKFSKIEKIVRNTLAIRGVDEAADLENAGKEKFNRILQNKRFDGRLESIVDRYTSDPSVAKINKILVGSDSTGTASRNFVIDYTKKAWSKGIPLIEIEPTKRLFTSETKIRYSNKFIQDTNINGLNSFDAGNAHTLPSERGKIKKLVPVAGNILAVHERACTTLYIEEGIIRAAEGGGALVTTRNVIGHNSKLQLEYGAYHGESVAKNDLGHVFGFDVYKGVVWRYTNEGLASIVNDDMAAYFSQKGEEYLLIKDTCRIIGYVDSANDEYIITFRKDDGSGETWAYNYAKNKWCGRYSFIPEMGASIGNLLLSFKDGKLYKHTSTTYNNFYGVQYDRTIKVAVNPFPGTIKVYNGIVIAAKDISDDDDEIIARFYAGDQESYCKRDEFDKKQGLHLGPILKDVNTPNIDAGKIALRDGDDMRGEYLSVELITSLTTRAPMRYFEITYNKSEFSK